MSKRRTMICCEVYWTDDQGNERSRPWAAFSQPSQARRSVNRRNRALIMAGSLMRVRVSNA